MGLLVVGNIPSQVKDVIIAEVGCLAAKRGWTIACYLSAQRCAVDCTVVEVTLQALQDTYGVRDIGASKRPMNTGSCCSRTELRTVSDRTSCQIAHGS